MATKKKLKKKMATMVANMPLMTTLTQEEHYVKGQELIDQGHTEQDGIKIDPEKMYRQMMPVIMARNHEKGFMKAFAQGGREGVTNYIKRMRQKVEKATA